MGMFGFGRKRPEMYGRDPILQGFGNDAAGLLEPVQADPIARPFFGEGGTGRAIAGSIGDALLGFSGQGPVYAPAMQRQNQEARFDAQQAAAEARLNKPQVHFGENGAVYRVNPNGDQVETLQAPMPVAPKPTQLQQQVEYIRSLDPRITNEQAAELAQRSLSGYGYSDEAREGKVEDALKVAQGRGAIAQTVRSTPTYAQTHPRSSDSGGGGGGNGKVTSTRSLGGKIYRKIGGRWFED